MNKEILNELINRYEANLEIIYDKEKHNELFKWRAVQCWQREWIERAGEFSNFAERFALRGVNFWYSLITVECIQAPES